ncbi:chaplin family protein [Nonomuraea indica]|uniref:chaplin family protein n=1 Tax=Nonomuraea indica TaxID=1581193 RepID=UPI000C7E4965|nr:chaplin family protein [Nonomuraea indica]
MRTWAKASTPAALLAVAVMSFGGGTALADTSGDHSIGGGNQVDAPISLPIDISGNSVAVAGGSRASSHGGASVDNQRGGGIPGRTSGDSSILGGNQVNAPISAPVNACGNAVSVFGGATAGCKGGATVKNTGKGGAGGNQTSGDHSILGGNQVVAPITAPVNACGNAVAVLGRSAAGCKGGASVKNSGRGAGGNTTSGRGSILGGNQVVAPISAPINVCGNSVAVLGRAFSGCKGGATVHNSGKGKGGHGYHPGRPGHGSQGNDTDGRFGAGSGNQVVAPISLPITACGNAVGNAVAGCKGGASVHNSGRGAGGNTTSGRHSILGGNQVVAPITAPINVCGNAVAVLGRAFAGCKGGASVHNSGRGAGGNTTSGRHSILGGNQVVAPITAPINVCGNAVAVLGRAFAGCKGGASVHNSGRGAGGNTTSGRHSILGGNQVVAPITAPINVCGNAVAVLGRAFAGCKGGASVHNSGRGAGGNTTSGRHSILGGNQVVAPITAPINACGNAVAALGLAKARCEGGASADNGRRGAGGNTTSGRGSILGGNQVVAPITAPINVCGNAVAVLGDAAAGCLGGARVGKPGGGHPGYAHPGGKVARHQNAAAAPSVAGAGLPVVGGVSDTLGLPVLPGLPGLPGQPATPVKPVKPGKKARTAGTTSGSPLAAAEPATALVAQTPVGGAVTSATRSLPVGDVGLMSAARPAGVTGMNTGALFALVLGAMSAGSAVLFAATRRFRLGRR